ncbi:unnamed protein product [Aspergillus oryzae]|uniref:Unnamed protein product n=1 Tax=Aspergillus oryzae TaxID=5062 RepID=A0AAN5BZH5_ASPOZ|nr:unnamed protein product [Aspergillus oryzae]GMF84498.1 unnamed protein product [Aspergillus oryzae]GMG11147.1 unnamed protein product [Aspergillus oryzae]GMG32896.1 unnamed protein product [Aspergillus oryzae]
MSDSIPSAHPDPDAVDQHRPANAEDRKAAAALSSLNTNEIGADSGAKPPSSADQEALGKAMSRLEIVAGQDAGKKTTEQQKEAEIDQSKNQPTMASTARAHHMPPTMLYLSPSPKPHPPIIGPRVRAPLAMLCATPWTVPRTRGSVTLLFTRMIAAGCANVRETTCNPTTTVNAGQTSHGYRGIRTINGMSA